MSMREAIGAALSLTILLAVLLVSRCAEAHDGGWYPEECCHGQDCKPVKAFVDDDGFWEVYVDQDSIKGWFKVPHSQVRKTPSSPDQGCHACFRRGMGMGPSINFFCFFPCAPKS